MSVKIINRHPKSDNSKLKSNVGTLLNDYLDHSTIQGVDYIFNSKEKLGGKIFWMVVVLERLRIVDRLSGLAG